jgi:hypothetical protein
MDPAVSKLAKTQQKYQTIKIISYSKLIEKPLPL